MRSLIAYGFIFLLIACGSLPQVDTKDAAYVLRETIAKGDTGMIVFGKLKPLNIAYDLCQHWELLDADDASSRDLTYDPETGDHLFQEMFLFKDSTVTINPRNGFRTGKWRLGKENDELMLQMQFEDGSARDYYILKKQYNFLTIAWKEKNKIFGMKLSSDARAHANQVNDPFHPSNNQWRVKPEHSESDSQIRERVRSCVKFYALYFRDHIKRNKQEINFFGLPSCFLWYKRGIGLYQEDELPGSWKNCFYSVTEAIKGRKLLKALFDKYDFDWPKNTRSWFYETHSVLEQMYWKL